MRVVKGEVVGRDEGSFLSLIAVDGPRMVLPYPASPNKLCSTASRLSSTF